MASESLAIPKTGPVELLIEARTHDLGEFEVRRTLPRRTRQRVGPCIFFDHMGPAQFSLGNGVAVRPHPHIGLATLTYLFEGTILHRDSLGSVQPIEPGAVNWMVAGRGIVHSERSPPDSLAKGSRLHGLQFWLAMPLELEEIAPSFVHTPAAAIPVARIGGVTVNVVVGAAYGHHSPVATTSSTLFVSADLPAGTDLAVPDDVDERAVYVVSGGLRIGEHAITPGTMAVLRPDTSVTVAATEACKLVILGGSALAGERHLYWNFVHSSRERIEQAKDDWRNGRFAKVPGDTEFIPLPD